MWCHWRSFSSTKKRRFSARHFGSRARVTTSAYLVSPRASLSERSTWSGIISGIPRYPLQCNGLPHPSSPERTYGTDGETRNATARSKSRRRPGCSPPEPRLPEIRVDVVVVDDLLSLGRLIRRTAAAAAATTSPARPVVGVEVVRVDHHLARPWLVRLGGPDGRGRVAREERRRVHARLRREVGVDVVRVHHLPALRRRRGGRGGQPAPLRLELAVAAVAAAARDSNLAELAHARRRLRRLHRVHRLGNLEVHLRRARGRQNLHGARPGFLLVRPNPRHGPAGIGEVLGVVHNAPLAAKVPGVGVEADAVLARHA
mmetsp:Transcript_10827/g.45464  ORF Transcript_10827/g.45464 Transcript_10827/m.45464 type:complete len:316 (-) Transcript_10827:942-1889(-)